MPAAASQAPMRLSKAVSTAPAPAAFTGRKPTTKACAGSAMTSKVMRTTSMVPPDSPPPNRDHNSGHVRAENTPASAAVRGEGVMFNSGRSTRMQCGDNSTGSRAAERRPKVIFRGWAGRQTTARLGAIRRRCCPTYKISARAGCIPPAGRPGPMETPSGQRVISVRSTCTTARRRP